MKKISYIYIIQGLVFCTLLTQALGWNNYPEFAPSENGFSNDQWEAHLHDWRLYQKDYDYSSHDWIADEALRLVRASAYSSLWKDGAGRDFWTPDRVKIFLYATMGPDSSSIMFSTRIGEIKKGDGDKINHHYYFDSQTRTPTDNPLATRAHDMAEKAIRYLRLGDCDTAAFYLGEMAGYMGDAGCFGHVNLIPVNIHGPFEGIVASRMDSCFGVARTSARNPYNPKDMYECFLTWVSPLQVHPFYSVEQATAILAYNTRFNPDTMGVPGPYNAIWLASRFEAGVRYPAPPIETWNWHYMRDEWQGYESFDLDAYNFWNRIEQNINDAVLYIADAMTWVITQVGSYTCKADIREVQQSITRYLSLGTAFMLLSYLGMYLVQYFLKSALIVQLV